MQNPNGAYNYGRCEKCLRTMINLRTGPRDGAEPFPIGSTLVNAELFDPLEVEVEGAA